MGFSDFLKNLFGKKSDRDIKDIMPLVNKTLEIYESFKNISFDGLRQKSDKLKQHIKKSVAHLQTQIDNYKADIEADKYTIDEKEEIYKKIDSLEEEITKKLEEVLLESLPEAFAIVKKTAFIFKNHEEIRVLANDFDRNLTIKNKFVTIEGEYAIYKNRWLAGGNEVVWNMVHYDVQLIGGIILHQGKIAEMATGEGKTLVATLPIFLNALSGRGVHVVTVNDYLAKRDSEWMGPIFQFHGLSIDCIDKHPSNSDARRNAYHSDITYGTNNEFGFDYLRDNMSISPEDLVQRRHNYGIVDEVDSVLIDDARTPLIISGPVPRGDKQLFDEYKPQVAKLVEAQRKLTSQKLVDAKKLIAEGNKDNKGAFALLQAYKGLPKNKPLIKYLSEHGVKSLMLKTEDIYMAENGKRMGEVTDELYFVIDEKHNSIDLTDRGIDLLSQDVNDNKFFILPDIGSELADIEKSGMLEAERLQKKDDLMADYAIKSERVHTVNQLLKAYTLFEKDDEYILVEGKVKIVDEQTGRVMEGRRYSDGLHQAIEAKENVKVEAATQTFATITLQNYFRMYSKLSGMTGTAETEAGEFWDIYKLDVVVIPTNVPVIREDREDLVFKTKREKYNAVADEIVELVKVGRPVLVGTTSVEISELLSRMLQRKGIEHNVLNAKLHAREADIVQEAGKKGVVTIATNMAGRGTDIKLSEEVKKAGGLAIIGTERHESRRVDRQLRGRSGRQGDVGSSQFFVSLEDDLMRLFGSERISKVMDRMGLQEGEVIQHSMISKSIERAQKKVEENNFGMRKRLLEYDDVMNTQRTAIYKKRRNALFGERVEVDISNMVYDVCQLIVDENHGVTDFEDFKFQVIRYLSIESPVNEQTYLVIKADALVEKLYETAIDVFKRKMVTISDLTYPILQRLYDERGKTLREVIVPITDGKRVFNVLVNLETAVRNKSRETVKSFEKTIILHTIDELWKEHLREMDDLKQSVQNASYEQKDPLLIYKFESFNLFKAMLDRNNKRVVSALMKGHLYAEQSENVKEAQERKRTDMSKYKTQKTEAGSTLRSQNPEQQNQPGQPDAKIQPMTRTEPKIGRNDPCPCGSGKKYKQCHGKPVAIN